MCLIPSTKKIIIYIENFLKGMVTMATVRKDKVTKLTLNVIPTGTSNKTANRIFNYVNPTITDDKTLYYGNKLSTLTSDALQYVQRTDIAKLVEE